MRKMLRYYVNTGGKWIDDGNGGGSNFIVFNCQKAATRYFMAKPNRQLDVRGLKNGRRIKACWKYWNKGKVIVQYV